MREPLDVGVTTAQVSALLDATPILSIVGFQRSGKSTLAEMLHRDLRHPGRKVKMQAASKWFQERPPSDSRSDASVDPEISAAMDELERAPGSCWIVDDAEVMFAYATETVLATLAKRIRDRQLSLVLVRNRFVLEGEGWFHQQQGVIAQDIPTLNMRPMEESSAVEAATAMFHGEARVQQGQWLASMSGGVPGMMSDLYPYTPQWPSQEPDALLVRYAKRRRDELELDKPARRMLVQALAGRVLPPPPLLSDDARRELGVLMLAGMISAQYATASDPFQGKFWHLVAQLDGEGPPAQLAPISHAVQAMALTMESMLSETELLGCVKEGFGIGGTDECTLALAIAASVHCEEHFPSLVRKLEPFLGELLGRFGLMQILRRQDIAAPPGASAMELVSMLFEKARS